MLNRLPYLLALLLVSAPLRAQAPAAQRPVPVPQSAPEGATERAFVDKHYHVKFRVPPGWELSTKDGTISTFHEDARSAPPNTQLRGIAELDYNPYPYSTLAGAIFYYSVEPHTTDAECAAQASPVIHAVAATPESTLDIPAPHKDVQNIAGMPFTHGHDEHGSICVEARDEVYTAWHKHSCFRFDLAMNTFCSEPSGQQPITDKQVHDIVEKMTGILSTVTLGWERSGAHLVPVPELPPEKPIKKPLPNAPMPAQGN